MQYEMLIPRMDVEVSRELLEEKQRDGFRVFMNGLFLLMEKKMRLVNFLMQPMKLSGESQGMRHSSVRKCVWSQSKRRIP